MIHMLSTLNLKPVSVYFLIIELLDVITTIVGILVFGAIELNGLVQQIGWVNLFIIKILAIGLVFYVIQKFNFSRKIIIVPIIATLPVLWNLINIIVEMLY